MSSPYLLQIPTVMKSTSLTLICKVFKRVQALSTDLTNICECTVTASDTRGQCLYTETRTW